MKLKIYNKHTAAKSNGTNPLDDLHPGQKVRTHRQKRRERPMRVGLLLSIPFFLLTLLGYVKVATEEDGFKLRTNKNGTVTFGAAPLAEAIRTSLGKDSTLSIPLAASKQMIDGDAYFALITASVR